MTNKLLTILLGLVFVTVTEAQDVVRTVDTDTYEQVLETLMPMTLVDVAFDYGYVIRIRPSSEAEYALRLVAHEGKIDMLRYESSSGNLFSHLSKLVEGGAVDDPTALARNIKVKTKTKVLPEAKFGKLRKEFASKLSLALERSRIDAAGTNDNTGRIIMHGTVYEIKYFSPERENISYWVYGYPINAKTNISPLVPWISNVLRFFEEH